MFAGHPRRAPCSSLALPMAILASPRLSVPARAPQSRPWDSCEGSPELSGALRSSLGRLLR
eukprot:6260207-Alexandrium_andersonii.AAC.1